MFRTVTEKKIAMFGFAFKKDTGDTRETAAANVAKYLLEERAQVHVLDPKVKEKDMWLEFKYTLGLDKASIEDHIRIDTDPYAVCKVRYKISMNSNASNVTLSPKPLRTAVGCARHSRND